MGSFFCFYGFSLFKFSGFWLKILIGFDQIGEQKTIPNKLGFNLHQNIKREINTGGLVILTFGQEDCVFGKIVY